MNNAEKAHQDITVGTIIRILTEGDGYRVNFVSDSDANPKNETIIEFTRNYPYYAVSPPDGETRSNRLTITVKASNDS